MSRYALIIFQKVGQKFGRNSFRRSANQDFRRFQRVNPGQDVNDVQDQDVVDGDEIGTSLAVALDTTVAIVKVGVLLFLKMFMLPLFLGSCLDASTLHLFGHDVARRLAFAGADLFSFILLHWVAGITFMLLVTVFLLQLREVVHPDVLARVIRPQEPQPDLLGNLLHETVVTHMKRMLLSLIIYAPLLSLHIFLPVKLFLGSGWENDFNFFHLNLYHILMPQLQIPLELITFHLSMLALLERYKNSIGSLQHRWLKFMCRKLELTEYLLPKTILGFEQVGTKKVFAPRQNEDSLLEVDAFLMELANSTKLINDDFILTNIDKSNASCNLSCEIFPGDTLANGERVLSVHTTHIAFPGTLNEGNINNAVSTSQEVLLPTKVGRYRLRLNDGDPAAYEPIVEFFREVQGTEISRPPEGWDDLGAGGAWAQGRWAWSAERKSVIEGGVAHSTPFRASAKRGIPVGLTLKVVTLIILSWFAITATAVVLLSAPLAVGRSFFFLLRIPKKYLHDPFAFCIGAGLFFPTMSFVTRHMGQSEVGILKLSHQWLSKFHRPPAQKLLVVMESFSLWFLAAPIMFGLSYEMTVVRSQQWFAGEETLFDFRCFIYPWLLGTVVLNTWSFLLYFNFFTKQFWTNIGNGILEPPFDENGNANPLARNRDLNLANRRDVNNNDLQLFWQGNRGRAANFYRIWQSVLVTWEWDAVDRTKLVDDFARPVAKQLASALIGSFLSFQLLHFLLVSAFRGGQGGINFPLLGLVDHIACRIVLFRFCMLLHVLLQVSSGFSGHIDGWFEAAHEAARDDRYLIGEVLLNYDPSPYSA
jgi:E3 ubiquitin-protein ligase MARCH6